AEQENAGSHYGLSDFKEIIGKIGETLKLQESKEFAASIQKNLFLNSKKQNANVYNFGVKRAPFIVLLGVDVPAVLAEVSCLSNREEEIELNTESHRENIARYLEAGILDYLNKGEVSYEAKRSSGRR
ncbi:MAG: N-acetylmuramoyl-L-alanine amidase, partial [Thermodesulfovibrionales bacterium]